MKRITAIVLLMAFLLCGCAESRTEVSREEIVAAYEAAGYSVSTRVYEEKLEHGEIAYVQANHPNGDYIYFSIFESASDARTYKEEYYHPVMMGLFSVIYGDPSWQRWQLYGCIVAQYNEPEFLEPFRELCKRK